MTRHITAIAPQFLVYDSFDASVTRDGFAIHLKHAPRLDAERAHREENDHLDAHIAVTGIRELFAEQREMRCP